MSTLKKFKKENNQLITELIDSKLDILAKGQINNS